MIDLTDGDDEVVPPVVPNNSRPRMPFHHRSLNGPVTWMSVSAPISNHVKNGINQMAHGNTNANNNRVTSVEKNSLHQKVDYYKPHQLKHMNSMKQPQQPIDLTLDDDEDDRRPPLKRMRGTTHMAEPKIKDDTEDGQVDDSASSSSSDSMMKRSFRMKKTDLSHK